VVSWPDDPAAGVNSAAQGTDQVAPGVFIYYLPLASGLWKGDNGHVWTKGWGDRFNSFWCCYGTAVESFSKLADSIYFHLAPDGYAAPGPVGGGSDGHQASKAATPGGGGTQNPTNKVAGPRRAPELFVNQLVSSTLRWRQLGVTLTQRAELYPSADNVARSQLGIAVEPPPSGGNKSGAAAGASASFVLRWRIPSWADKGAIELRVDGRAVDVRALLRLAAADGGRAGGGAAVLGFSPPAFGAGAAYVPLGPGFKDGSVGERRLVTGCAARAQGTSLRARQAPQSRQPSPLPLPPPSRARRPAQSRRPCQ
jgi:hypothetical protein